MKIIIAQPDADILEQLSYSLAELGTEVHATDSVEAVVSCIQRQLTVDVILSDTNFTGSSVYDLLVFLRSNLRFRSIPVVICSHNLDEQAVIGLIRAGAKGFIRLPLPPDTLLQKIEGILLQARSTVLIAVPDLVLRDIVSRMMDRRGYQVLTARTALELLEGIRDHRVDVVLIDPWHLGANPWSLLVSIKESQPHSGVLFIFDRDCRVSEQHVITSGADGLIRKPIVSNVLENKVRQMLLRSG